MTFEWLKNPYVYLIYALVIALALLWFSWRKTYGPWRGSLATLARALWVIPVFLALFPLIKREELPQSLELNTIHVLLDDSESMKKKNGTQPSFWESSQAVLGRIKDYCQNASCLVQERTLSQLSAETQKGFSPLRSVLESWRYEVGLNPWVVLTDGGDSQPLVPWPDSLKDFGLNEDLGNKKLDKKSRGMIVGFESQETENIWIDKVNLPPFSFESKSILGEISLKRKRKHLHDEVVQVQVQLADKVLLSVNVIFQAQQDQARADLLIPALAKGQYLLTMRSLPAVNEVVLWDNVSYVHTEVLNNTIGILHLLGSPSWDGRFLRRYLKKEPKYDLISFFILRDPWDSQEGNERELSLIPFPVARLFNEELKNFRAIVLQNFNLLQFLLPEYQQNLVSYVKNGGSLFFIGGPRALLDADINNSSLREILPFEVEGQARSFIGSHQGSAIQRRMSSQFGEDDLGMSSDKNGPWFEKDLKFKVEMANPSVEQRELANVYDDWGMLSDLWPQFESLRGLHHLENVKLKKNESTPLLNAKLANGTTIPLALASYPGKGRAIWLFTDSSWRMAQDLKPEVSRDGYYRFIETSFHWLMRSDFKKPLVVSQFEVLNKEKNNYGWRASLQGAALKSFTTSPDWRIRVCGMNVDMNRIGIEAHGSHELWLSGNFSLKTFNQTQCAFELDAVHKSFGSVMVRMNSPIHQVLLDQEVYGSRKKLIELAQLTKAEWVQLGDETLVNSSKNPAEESKNESFGFMQGPETVAHWLSSLDSHKENILNSRVREHGDYYWIFSSLWFWFFLMFLPLEVLFRRWHQLGLWGMRSKKDVM